MEGLEAEAEELEGATGLVQEQWALAEMDLQEAEAADVKAALTAPEEAMEETAQEL